MNKILVLDNYDSFTYNLVHYIEALGHSCDVFRNDKIELDAVAAYDKIVLSPGPGIPEEAGMLIPLIERFAPEKSIFGVCLGLQAIGQVFGAELYNIGKVVHGKQKNTRVVSPDVLFENVPEVFPSGRYHSWAIRHVQPPLHITAVDDDGVVMAIKHESFNVRAVQFHPESVMTPDGMQMIRNWLTNC